MTTPITDAESALSAQIDEQGGQLEAWRDRAIAAEDGIKRHEEMAAMATAEIADLTADLARLRARVAELEAALLDIARHAEALKRECGMDPESPQAIRNAQYMGISYKARAAMKVTT